MSTRERQQGWRSGGVDEAVAAADVEPSEGAVTFSALGPFPQVAADVSGGATQSASELAFGGASSNHMLGFGGFGGSGGQTKPRAPRAQTPLVSEDDLEVIAARGDVERLLKAKGMDASKHAGEALELLYGLEDGALGKAIDGLDAKAFDNLLDRISHDQRERFSRLVAVSQNPERKLRLWAEAHKSRVTNNVAKQRGDIGPPIAMYQDEEEDEEGNVEIIEEVDEEAEDELRETLSKPQLRNRKRHLRREAAAKGTQGEVDHEVKALTDKAKKDKTALSLADVDALIERKELEYTIELESNVHLTANTSIRDNGSTVHWSTSELGQVQRTLQRLAHTQDPDSFDELERERTWDVFNDGVGGRHSGDSIEVTDVGTWDSRGFRHGGDKRELVSDEFKEKHGETIRTLEFVLTHEIGHDVADKNEATFDAFKKAAGWELVTADAVEADGVDAVGMEELEKQRKDPNAKTKDITGRTRIFTPDSGTKFWSVPVTSIPAADEAAPGPRGEDTWAYARVNPSEHFAELYAKAVHVPEKLHDELIVKPAENADKARELYAQMKRKLDGMSASQSASNRDLKLANLRVMVGVLETDMRKQESIRDARAEQFAVMRNSVFGTDKACKLALERLQAKKVSADKIAEFKERAAGASTPEQIAFLESEVSK